MLIELLALLIFLAFAFAFAMKEEGDRLNPWKQKYDQIVVDLAAANATIKEQRHELRVLQAKVASLEASIRRLAAAHDGPLAANDKLIPLPKVEYDRLLNDRALLAALQAENARLRARLNHGGTDRPNCLVTPGFLISVELLADGALRVSPTWTAEARGNVAEVTGALALGEGGRMSSQQFAARASQVDQWARSQVPACGFRARVSESHGNLTLYKRQVRTVEQYFYVRRD
jgi:hypothetical protein